jgi:hypothetical protein
MTLRGLNDYFRLLTKHPPGKLGFAVYFDGSLFADTVFNFEETAQGHAEENVLTGEVSYAMVVEFSTNGAEIVYQAGMPPLGFISEPKLAPLGPRSRRSPLAERRAEPVA